MPAEFILKAYELDPDDAEHFFRYIVTSENKRFLASYAEAVVFKGEPTEKYGATNFYMPSVSLTHQLSYSRDQILPFSNGIFNIIRVGTFNNWKNGSYSNGCPLVERVGANYLTPTPKGAIALGETPHKILTNSQSIDVMFRRWIAQRAAMQLFRNNNTSIDDCIPLLQQHVPLETWTEDAVIAVNALLRERQEFGQKDGEVPGFIGPDEWFLK